MMDDQISVNILSRKHSSTIHKSVINNKTDIIGMTAKDARAKVTQYLSDNYQEILSDINEDEIKKEKIKKIIQEYCADNGVNIGDLNLKQTVIELYQDIVEYSFLTELIAESSPINYEEIRINDYNDVRIVVSGREYKYHRQFDSPEQLLTIAQKMCQNLNKDAGVIKESNPFVRLRIGNKTRVSIMGNPVARRPNDIINPVVHMTIRKQRSEPFTKKFLIANGTFDERGYNLIQICLNGFVSMAFYGGTNSGKTATMASVAQHISGTDRTISIAEVDEMNLRKIDENGNCTNSTLMWEIKENMDLQKCINSALTFSPQTIIIQEIKGDETVDAIDASITGHQVLTSLHADNKDVFAKRILGMYKQSGSDLSDDLILDYVVDAFPVLVRMKIYADKKRRVAEISELLSYNKSTGEFKTNVLYEFIVEDTTEQDQYDEYLQKVVPVKTVVGRHNTVNRPSERLVRLLLEGGVPKNDIDKLFNEWGSEA